MFGNLNACVFALRFRVSTSWCAWPCERVCCDHACSVPPRRSADSPPHLMLLAVESDEIMNLLVIRANVGGPLAAGVGWGRVVSAVEVVAQEPAVAVHSHGRHHLVSAEAGHVLRWRERRGEGVSEVRVSIWGLSWG